MSTAIPIEQRTTSIGDKEIVEVGIDSVADDLRAIFRLFGRTLEISERFGDEAGDLDDLAYEVTINGRSALLYDPDDEFDCDLPQLGADGTWPCREHMRLLIELLRAAFPPVDGATWQLANLDEDFPLLVATRDEMMAYVEAGYAVYDFD